MDNWKKRRVGRIFTRILRIAGWVFLSTFGLILLISLVIQIPAVQQKISQSAVTFLSNKIGTKVSLDRVSLSFPKKIVLGGIFFEDQHEDTLLYIQELSIDTDLIALLKKRIELNTISVSRLNASVIRTEDSLFNFSYIIRAFSENSGEKKDTTQSNWVFSIEDVELNAIQLSYVDAVQGLSADIRLRNLEVGMDEFDLEKSQIYVDELLLAGIHADVAYSPGYHHAPSAQNNTNEDIFDFKLNSANLNEINIRYTTAYEQEVFLNLGSASIKADDINLNEHRIALTELQLSNTFFAYHQLSSSDSATSTSAPTPDAAKGSVWDLSLHHLVMEDNSFQYYNSTRPKQHSGVDFDNLWISAFNADIGGIKVSESNYNGHINKLSFRERSGFHLQSLKGVLAVDQNSAALKDFSMQTRNSQLQFDFHGGFSSLDNLKDELPNCSVECVIRNSHISVEDVNFFLGDLRERIPREARQANVHIAAAFNGKVNDLQIEQLNLSALKETSMAVRGRVRNLPEVGNAFFDITVDEFRTTSADATTVLPDTFFQSINLPAWIDVTGNFLGTVDAPYVKSTVHSEYGSVIAEADLKQSTDHYKGSFDVRELDIGKLLKKEDIFGPIDLTGSFNGSDITAGNHDVEIDVKMNSFEVRDYSYKDLVVNGRLKDYLFAGNARMNDPNLNFELDGDLDWNFDKKKRAYHFDFNLNNADFKALHLTERPLKARLAVVVDIDNADPADLNGKLSLHNVAIYNGEKLYKVDSLLFASLHDEEKTELSIKSDLMNGKFSGSFNLVDLPEVLKDYFDTYYDIQDSSHFAAKRPQQFSFDLKIDNTALLTDILIPELKRFVPGEIKGDFNSETRKLNVSINVDEIEYGAVYAKGLTFEASSDQNNLNYKFQSGKILASVVSIPSLAIQGDVADNKMNTSLVIYDSLEKVRYGLRGIFTRAGDAFRFHLDPDDLILDYADWNIPEDNSISISRHRISTSNFNLTNNEQQIIVETKSAERPFTRIGLHKLRLATLAHMAISNDTLISGVIEGDIRLYEHDNFSLLKAGIDIADVSLSKKELGDVQIILEQPIATEYNLKMVVSGPATRIDVDGKYISKDSLSEVNVVGNISSLDLAAIEPLISGQVRKVSGNVAGQVRVSGNTNSPDIDGKITFQKTYLIPTYINTSLKLENETLVFSRDEITITNFRIRDENDNPLTINGRIELSDFQRYNLDLTARARDFLLLNTKEGDNDLFYGKLVVDANVVIKGTANQPDVNAQLSMGDESDITYVVPQENITVMEQRGVVKFVDRDVHQDPFLAAVEKEAQSREDSVSFIQGITLTANIEIDDKETVNILIDPLTEDKLTVNGNSTLTLDIDPTGNTNLSGRYELTKGSYGITFYKLVKREFEIQKGSTITWSGDLLNADLDITGLYRVETSPAELLQSQSATSDPIKQRLPFIVYLKVEGKILTPEISFSIDMPEQQRSALGGSVFARLQDINSRESDLNKQVFSLLILKRFIADNPFETQGGATLGTTARTSVSRFLTEQLNRMSENIEGVQLTFDLKSYEEYADGEAGGRTQLELGLSKNLLSDRLVVKLSGNVDLEGNRGQQQFSDYIGDLALEYKITEDGRFRVTGFYNSDYDMIDGELKDAGIGLIYIRDYDLLSELFKANDKERK